jgi:beta-glucosidase
MNQNNLILLSSIIFCLSCTSLETNEIDSSLTISQKNSFSKRVDSIFELMTLEEKIGQLNQYSVGEEMTGPNQNNDYSKQRYNQLINGSVGSVLNLLGAENTRLVQQQVIENSRLKIPLIFAYDVIHGYKTIFPIPLAESCSWDLKLMEKTAKASAAEAAASGIQWTFAPMIDVSRDARWGRVMEGAGEDPFLGAQVAAARIKGFQGESLSDSLSIAACAKHFAAYGFVESGKDYNTVNIGQNTLMNVVLPPFKMAAKNNVATFMNAFNDIDGIPATANFFLLKEILREKWNYEGVVVSDWGSIGEMVNHRYSKDLKQAAHQAIAAGCDIDMESQAYIKHLKELVEQNPDLENEINKAVKRILTLKFKLGLFDDPYKYSSLIREKNVVGSSAHLDLALEAALKSIVLLKNENQLLPLKKNQKIAIIGALANDSDAPLGNWRAHASSNSAINLLDGMRTVFESNFTFAKGCELSVGSNNFFEELKINNSDYSGFSEAVDLARKSEIVVMALGEPAYMSGEGRSRSNIALPGVQLELLKEVYKVNKNIVLVLMNGRPLTIPWEYKNIPAIVEAWHCGSSSGEAIAKILIGDYNPSGKLTMSFPRNVGQIPIYYNKKTTGRPSSGPNQVFYVHHSDVDNDPLFPFGYGLSYTQFEYSEMKISKNEIYMNDTLKVTIKVQNIGNFSGEEIVQLYITDEFASVTLPEMELKGFQKISLAVGESKQAEFNITKQDLSFYNKQNVFIAEPGSFIVGVGTNSKNLDVMSFNLVQ